MNKFYKYHTKYNKYVKQVSELEEKLSKLNPCSNYNLCEKKLNIAKDNVIFYHDLMVDIIIHEYVNSNFKVGSYVLYNYDNGFNTNIRSFEIKKIRKKSVRVITNMYGDKREEDLSYKEIIGHFLIDKYGTLDTWFDLDEHFCSFIEEQMAIKVRDETLNFLIDE